jgi:NADP-dependent 3-hydroxy acid dehydrogenase YdfG
MMEKKVVLITGASSGIGEACARRLAREGFRVALAARRIDRLVFISDEIEAAGGEAYPVKTDISNLDDIQTGVQKIIQYYGRIDVLVNNAGFGRLKWLEDMDPIADIRSQIDVNLTGLIWMTHAVLPHMIAQQRGHIINMASTAAFVATPTYTVYAATKFAVRGFTEALRREVGIWGVHVSGLYPGAVDTEFQQHTAAKRKTGITTPKRLRLSADDVARTVSHLLQRPQKTEVIPGFMRLSVLLNSLFPGWVDYLVEKRFVLPERKG